MHDSISICDCACACACACACVYGCVSTGHFLVPASTSVHILVSNSVSVLHAKDTYKTLHRGAQPQSAAGNDQRQMRCISCLQSHGLTPSITTQFTIKVLSSNDTKLIAPSLHRHKMQHRTSRLNVYPASRSCSSCRQHCQLVTVKLILTQNWIIGARDWSSCSLVHALRESVADARPTLGLQVC